MMRLQQDYDSIPRHRRADADPSPTEPLAVEPRADARTESLPSPRSPIAQPVLALSASREDLSVPRASRTGIAPAPIPIPHTAPHMTRDDIREEVRANTRFSARMLIRTLRLSQYYADRTIARIITRTIHRITCHIMRCDIPHDLAVGPGLRIERPFAIMIDRGVRIGARCTLRHGVTLTAEGADAPIVGHDVEFGSYAHLTGKVQAADGSRIPPLSHNAAAPTRASRAA